MWVPRPDFVFSKTNQKPCRSQFILMICTRRRRVEVVGVVVISRYSERRLFHWFQAGDEGEASSGSCWFFGRVEVICVELDC